MVDEYSSKFDRVARFAPHLVPTKVARSMRSKDGLLAHIKLKFLIERIKTTEEVIDLAIIVEDHWIIKSKRRSHSLRLGMNKGLQRNKRRSPQSLHTLRPVMLISIKVNSKPSHSRTGRHQFLPSVAHLRGSAVIVVE